MKPTNKLRFVERLMYWDGRTSNAKTVKVLQQWWEPTQWNAEGEWRDVPLEAE